MQLPSRILALRQWLTHNNVGEAARWIAGIDCYALRFSSLDETAELLAQVADHGQSGALSAR